MDMTYGKAVKSVYCRNGYLRGRYVKCQNGRVKAVIAFIRDLTWAYVQMEGSVACWNGIKGTS